MTNLPSRLPKRNGPNRVIGGGAVVTGTGITAHNTTTVTMGAVAVGEAAVTTTEAADRTPVVVVQTTASVAVGVAPTTREAGVPQRVAADNNVSAANTGVSH